MAKIVNNKDLTPQALKTLSKDERDWVYNGLDCCVTFEVYKKQLAEADDIALNTYAFSKALQRPVFEMNLRGVQVDFAAQEKAQSAFKQMMQRLEHNFERLIYEGIGITPPFNWRSYHQLKFLFYKVMDLKPIRARNSAGVWAPTVNRDAIEKLQQYWSARPICSHIIAMRELDKRIQFLEKEIDDDGRARTSYNIAGTNTGRLSSSTSDFGTGGNNQNVEEYLRRIFIPDRGYKFCNIDLEQADSRNVGAICWNLFVDKFGEDFAGSYLNACESGDLHTTVSNMVWPTLEWPEDDRDWKEFADAPRSWYREWSYRDGSKKLGHGTNFYGTPPTMAMHLRSSRQIIEDFQLKYFKAFPVIGAVKHNLKTGKLIKDHEAICWHNWVRQQLEEFGFLQTPFYNRRRFFFGRPNDDRTVREAIAYAPQSMTADAIDTGIMRLWNWGRVQLLIQVHDSVLFQFPEELEEIIVPEALRLLTIKHELKRGREFFIPAEAKVGWNWGEFDSRNPDDNPDGLIKWKGEPDTRPRPPQRFTRRRKTFREMLEAA